jgi:hypothetical protein
LNVCKQTVGNQRLTQTPADSLLESTTFQIFKTNLRFKETTFFVRVFTSFPFVAGTLSLTGPAAAKF